MADVGGNPEELRLLAIALQRQADQSDALRMEIDKSVNGTVWRGDSRQRFLDTWNSQYAMTLRNLATGLADLSREVRQRADGLDLAMNR
jgi:uncharacterized protein YukE